MVVVRLVVVRSLGAEDARVEVAHVAALFLLGSLTAECVGDARQLELALGLLRVASCGALLGRRLAEEDTQHGNRRRDDGHGALDHVPEHKLNSVVCVGPLVSSGASWA